MKRTLRPASKAAIAKILAHVRRHDRFLCSGHVRSDGDALGAQLALNSVLRKLGKKSHCVCDYGVMPEYRFLPGSREVGGEPADLRPPYSTIFTCDSGSWRRLERIAQAIDRKAVTVVCIDHHASNERFGDINWIDPQYSSTGEMIWDLAQAARVKLDRDIATNVYTAIVTDTGSFRFSNTTVETHLHAAECLSHGVLPADITKLLYRQKSLDDLKLASLVIRDLKLSDDGRVAWVSITPELIREAGRSPTETQEFMDLMKSIKNVEIAILFREVDGKIKVSWRTDRGIDGIELATRWGGGGHPRASGASVEGPMAEVERQVVEQALEAVRGKRVREPAREGTM